MDRETTNGETKMSTMQTIERLEQAGLTAKQWKTRIYVHYGDRELGYLVPEDDGSTGTCKNITRRRGYVASILRGES